MTETADLDRAVATQAALPGPATDREGTEFGRAVVKKVIRRLLPFIFICYVVAYIDRVNIGFAANSLMRDLGLSSSVYGRGAGLFFLGYFLFEIPSNLILHRVGARRWIARIMIVWGIVSVGMMFVQGKWSFYGMRVALGLAEAGFFPGMVLYLTYWIPKQERARTGALFMMAAPIAMVVGGPVSKAILELDGALGLQGWQWLFILEGIPAVLLGVLTLKVLTDRPEQAAWLEPKEREWLAHELERERAERAAAQHGMGLRALANGRVLLLCLIYFLNTSVTYGIFLWLPKMMEDISGFKDYRLGLVNAIPFVAAIAGMIVIGAHSDRTGERKRHVAFCAALGALGLGIAVVAQDSFFWFVIGFVVCQIGQRSIMSVFWTIPPIFLGGTMAAAGIAMINAVGNLGGHFGSDMMGELKTRTGGYSGGLLVLVCALLLLATLVLSLPISRSPQKSWGTAR